MSAQELAVALLQKLGLSVSAGSVTLNFNEGKLASVKTETYQRIESDKRLTPK